MKQSSSAKAVTPGPKNHMLDILYNLPYTPLFEHDKNEDLDFEIDSQYSDEIKES